MAIGFISALTQIAPGIALSRTSPILWGLTSVGPDSSRVAFFAEPSFAAASNRIYR
jgi:hypothetical protein